MSRTTKARRAAAFGAALGTPWCLAQEAPVPEIRTEVVVTATRLPRSGLDIPAAIDVVDARAIREDKPQVNLSEAINRIPGIVVQNRQNYAQDLQVSSRGFGGRATFGVRGVRLIADGIPATMPDGQGQAASFDLATAERIEVLRGPFASLYGNASGGVIQVFTADGPKEPTFASQVHGGSYATWKVGAQFGGTTGSAVNYIGDVSRFETDGYRDHSAARRDQLNAKVKMALGSGELTLLANGLDQPETQDPLGLTRAQWEQNPEQADPSATIFNTRKSIRQAQAGAVYDVDAAGARWSVKGYAGDRQVTQYLGQAGDTPLSSGGVVDLDRQYGGVGLRVSATFGRDAPLTLVAGADGDRMKERRRGYVNNLGVAGALKRDEDDTVTNNDFYAQGDWVFLPQWILSGGARYSRVRFESKDFYIVGANPDDSGSVSYSKTTPVAGITYKVSKDVSVYANAGQGFETPTFAELAYRPGGATGLNFALRPSTSRSAEVGAKGSFAKATRFGLALFRIETRDEIVVNSNVGGRSDFKNASRTQRDGFEASLEGRAAGFEYAVAYTYLDARFTEAFSSGTPPAVVRSGSKLPGVPGSVLHGEVVWRHAPSGFHAGGEVHSAAKVYVNEQNSDAAPAYTIVNLRAGIEQRIGRWQLAEYARVDNVGDKRYAGSVIVSAAGGRYFEPAPGRNAMVGVQATAKF
jgi:iron complex outermembrane receptor protein